ncbi:MAG: YhfC family intramembrane metalloprotease [Firmicutes bacterium]|nr:YhfC family intramembrane metalloprotease [Bacillota bacterium]
MVSAVSLAAMFFSLFASLILPIGLAIYFYRKYHFSLKAFFAGAAVFIITQLLIRIPLLAYLSSYSWFRTLMEMNIFFSAVVIGGFTAALFEECGRYLGFRFILRKELSWENGLSYGLGHGGIESIILVGFGYINNIVISLMINSGTFEQFAAPRLGASASLVKLQLTSLPPSIFLAAGVERLLTLIIHIAFSLIVLYAVKQRRPFFLLLAILLHTALNAGAVYLQNWGVAFWFIELFIAIFAAAALCLVIKSKKDRNWFFRWR